MTDRKRHSSLWLVPLTLLVGVGAGPATALSAPADQPLEVPQRDDRVTIGGGLDNSRSDLTYGEFLDVIEQLDEANPALEGAMYLYGLLPTGEIGVISICIETPVPEVNRLPHHGPDATGWACRPVPELERPGHNVAPNA